jgi:hypothetical protein
VVPLCDVSLCGTSSFFLSNGDDIVSTKLCLTMPLTSRLSVLLDHVGGVFLD